MYLSEEMILIIIPARSGSKGIKDKNLRKINHKSLLNLTIDFAKNLNFEKFILVSTDSRKYMNEALKSNCEIWPLRDKIYSNDNAPAIDVWRYEWLRFEDYFGRKIQKSVYLEPTSPLRIPEDVYQCLHNLNDEKECCFTSSQVSKEHSPYKMFKKGKDSGLEPLIPDAVNQFSSNRQILHNVYQRNGLCYAALRERIVMQRKIIDFAKTTTITTKRKVINIDTIDQLKEARKFLKYSFINK